MIFLFCPVLSVLSFLNKITKIIIFILLFIICVRFSHKSKRIPYNCVQNPYMLSEIRASHMPKMALRQASPLIFCPDFGQWAFLQEFREPILGLLCW